MKDTWLHKFTASMAEAESPERFFFWSGMAVLAACVKKNVWLDRYRYVLYPNIYVICLSAKSGLRKGIPAMYAKNLVESTKLTRAINGRYTIQALISLLSKQLTTEEGIIFSDAQALIIAPELKSLFSADPDALSILTDLQNTHEHEKQWSSTTIGRNTDTLKNPCISLLGFSNAAYFEEVVKGADIEGGFVARTFIIHESKRRVINSLMKKPDIVYPKKELEEYLKGLLNVRGEFQIKESTKILYDDWYRRIAELEYEDRTGTLERLGDQVLKAAMLISLSRNFKLIIDDEVMSFAINICEENFSGTRRVADGEGKAPMSKFAQVILKVMSDTKDQGYKITRKQLLQKCYPNLTSIELDAAYQILSGEAGGGTGIMKLEWDGANWLYSLTDEGKMMYKNYIS